MNHYSHLDGCSRENDPEVGSQLFDGLGKLGLPILDHMTLIQDTVIEFDIPRNAQRKYNMQKSSSIPK